jgi:RNA polymerase sigma-70 factor (ECF subfamily)
MWLLGAFIDPRRGSAAGGRLIEEPAADRDAILRARGGEPQALAELYDRLGGLVFSLVIRIVEDWTEAEDTTQEVFTQVWRQAGRYDPSRGSVAAWVLTIARSRAIDAVRARRARPDATTLADDRTVADVPNPDAGQETETLAAEQVGALRRALAGLPLVQRLAIELAYYEGLTQAEIAMRLEQPLGTIKTRIRKGLMRLREALAEARP